MGTYPFIHPRRSHQASHLLPIMTRSHRANDRDHKGIAEGTALPVEAMPKFFAKSGFADVDPKKIKKDGGGRGNWGSYGDDIANENFTFVNPRRRSNSFSMSHHVNDFKTKFEVHEPEPVFEEALHGPMRWRESGQDRFLRERAIHGLEPGLRSPPPRPRVMKLNERHGMYWHCEED